MTDQEILTQLKKLKAVEPDKNWLMAARSEVLSKTPVFDVAVKTGFNISFVRSSGRDEAMPRLYGADNLDNLRRDKKSFVPESADNLYLYGDINKKRKFSFSTLFNFKQFQPAMAGLMIGAMVLGGGSILTVKASQNSLPGDSLYGVKRMMEGTQITIASDKNKPALETKFVGRRLEEMVKISEKASDIKQEEKIKKLAREVEEGMKKTENHLAALSESPKEAAKAAKTVNVQTEKYAAVLIEASEKMPEPVKKEVEETMDKAADSTEKVNFKALEIMAVAIGKDDKTEAEDAGISEEEVKVKIQVILDKKTEINEEPPLTLSPEYSGQGGEEEVGEAETEMEKVEVDCLECGKDSEDVCLEETDEKGAVECYIEQAVLTAEDKLYEAQINLDDDELTAVFENLKEADEIRDVKGMGNEEVLEVEGEEVLEDDLEIEN